MGCDVCRKKVTWTLREGAFVRLRLCRECVEKIGVFLDNERKENIISFKRKYGKNYFTKRLKKEEDV